MSPAASYVIAVLTVLLLLVAAAYAWYNHGNTWKQFSAAGAADPHAPALTFDTVTRTPAWIRFRNCTFTTQNPQGQTATWDVTAVLNGMATAHPTTPPSMSYPTALSLSDPLNPFSFVQAGFNDKATVPTAADSLAWGQVPASATSLTGEWTVLGAKAGSF